MKKIYSVLLSLILIFTAFPINAQSAGDLADDLNIGEVQAVTNKELNRIFLEEEERYEEFLTIYDAKKKELQEAKNMRSGTFRDTQNHINKSFAPHIDRKEAYKKSKYFKEKGAFFKYALKARYEALEMLEKQPPFTYEDYDTYVKIQVKNMFLQENNKNDNIFESITLDYSERNPISDAAYLAGYYSQNYDFYEAVDDARKTVANDCARLTPQESANDKDCQWANELAEYDPQVFKRAADRVTKIISTSASRIQECLKVLMLLQAKDNIIGREASSELAFRGDGLNWEACGVTRQEGMDFILKNTLTMEQADQIIQNQNRERWTAPFRNARDLKGVLRAANWDIPVAALMGLAELLEFISPSYYLNLYTRVLEARYGVGEERADEMSVRELNHEWNIGNLVTLSYNLALSQIATRLITYGKVFYYDMETFGYVKSFCMSDEKSEIIRRNPEKYEERDPSPKSHPAAECFARVWYRYGTGEKWQTPIATLMREAIMQSGRREYQDQRMQATIHAIRFNNNLKAYQQMALVGVDIFADPLELLAPAFAAVKISKATKVAEGTARAVNAVDNVTDIARVADRTSDVVRTTDNVSDVVRVADRTTDAGRVVTRGAGAVDDVGRGVTRGADAAHDAARGADAVDAAGDASRGAAATPPSRTALDPADLNKPLTGGVDDAVRAAEQSRNAGKGLRANASAVPEAYKSTIDDILHNIDNVKGNNSLTAAQREELNKAFDYFDNLTPEQLADANLYKSNPFRENAARLTSPNATEHGFFIDASGRVPNGTNEGGYIPHMLGKDGDLSLQELKDFFKNAPEAKGQPIYVRLEVHGEIDAGGNFYFIFGDVTSSNHVTTEQFADALQDLLKQTGASEVNLYSGACHSGQFLDEFAKLPQAKRKGVNIFATAGSPAQVNSTANTVLARSKNIGTATRQGQFSTLIDNVIDEQGNIFARAYVDGEMFDPLQQSLKRAQAEHLDDLVDRLDVLNQLHKSKKADMKGFKLDYSFAGGEWFPNSMIKDSFSTDCVGMDRDIVDFVKETAQKMRTGQRW